MDLQHNLARCLVQESQHYPMASNNCYDGSGDPRKRVFRGKGLITSEVRFLSLVVGEGKH